MAYVATVTLLRNGVMTGTSLAISGENATLTGSLTITDSSGDTAQYLDVAGTTATIPKNQIRKLAVA